MDDDERLGKRKNGGKLLWELWFSAALVLALVGLVLVSVLDNEIISLST
jgi:hypothetical protein